MKARRAQVQQRTRQAHRPRIADKHANTSPCFKAPTRAATERQGDGTMLIVSSGMMLRKPCVGTSVQRVSGVPGQPSYHPDSLSALTDPVNESSSKDGPAPLRARDQLSHGIHHSRPRACARPRTGCAAHLHVINHLHKLSSFGNGRGIAACCRGSAATACPVQPQVRTREPRSGWQGHAGHSPASAVRTVSQARKQPNQSTKHDEQGTSSKGPNPVQASFNGCRPSQGQP
jgi:hypothetical protein